VSTVYSLDTTFHFQTHQPSSSQKHGNFLSRAQSSIATELILEKWLTRGFPGMCLCYTRVLISCRVSKWRRMQFGFPLPRCSIASPTVKTCLSFSALRFWIALLPLPPVKRKKRQAWCEVVAQKSQVSIKAVNFQIAPKKDVLDPILHHKMHFQDIILISETLKSRIHIRGISMCSGKCYRRWFLWHLTISYLVR
jgi:hypothetical protein